MFQVVIMCNHWTFAFKSNTPYSVKLLNFIQTPEDPDSEWTVFSSSSRWCWRRGAGEDTPVSWSRCLSHHLSGHNYQLAKTCLPLHLRWALVSKAYIFTLSGTLNFMTRPTLFLRQLRLAFPRIAAAPSTAVHPCRLAAAVSEAGSLAATPHLERRIKVMWM